jgi:hypothetical protein
MVNNVYLGFFDKFNLLQSSFCCEEMTENNDKKIEVEQANNMTFITHGFRVSVVSDVRERVRDLASILMSVKSANNFQIHEHSWLRLFHIILYITDPSDMVR